MASIARAKFYYDLRMYAYGEFNGVTVDVDMPVGGYCCYGERRADNGEM